MHKPVLLNEVIEFLNPEPGDTILDATIDGGGHAKEILERIEPDGKLIGIDQDKELLDRLIFNFQFSIFKQNLILVNDNFRNTDKILKTLKIKKIDGALFDLGMSSLQLEESGRGFTFQRDEPLDMRYAHNAKFLTAAQIINNFNERDIGEILWKYGEERFGRRIAKEIVKARRIKPIVSTLRLVEIIKKATPVRYHHKRMHPATKTFQALRIAVNDELNALSEGLEKVWQFLNPDSCLVAISFHSLEDRIVKNFLKNKEKQGVAEIKTKKPVVPSNEEIAENPRSRSAKLRAAIKI